MAEAQRYTLTETRTTVLGADGAGSVEIGPGRSGPARWRVSGVILKTSRPGAAPIPRAEVALDQDTALQGLTYDGSFAQGRTDLAVVRGQKLIVKWTGGQAGDIASVTVTGEKW